MILIRTDLGENAGVRKIVRLLEVTDSELLNSLREKMNPIHNLLWETAHIERNYDTVMSRQYTNKNDSIMVSNFVEPVYQLLYRFPIVNTYL